FTPLPLHSSLYFFFIDPPPSQIYTLSLHDALPISAEMAATLVSPAGTFVLPNELSPHATTVLSPSSARLWPLPAAIASTLVKPRSEEHTSELQSLRHLVCRLLLEKKKKK